MSAGNSWLTDAGLAELLGVTERWVATKARAGLIPCHQLGPRLRRFSPDDVRAIEAKYRQPTVRDVALSLRRRAS